MKTPMQYLDRDPNAHRTDMDRGVPGFQKDIGRSPLQTFDGQPSPADNPSEEADTPQTPASEPEAPATTEGAPVAPTPAPAPNQAPVVAPTTDRTGGLG
jgi:hypothetical protein